MTLYRPSVQDGMLELSKNVTMIMICSLYYFASFAYFKRLLFIFFLKNFQLSKFFSKIKVIICLASFCNASVIDNI